MRLFDYDRASVIMDAAGADLILASSRPNVGYLSDYWYAVSDEFYVLWDLDVVHYTLCGLPKDPGRGPFLVAGSDETTVLERQDPWIKERHYWGPGYYVQTWKEKNPAPGHPMETAAAVLAEKGYSEKTIAVEMRYLGAGYLEHLKKLLPKARFVDAEPLLWKMRIVKTPEEIDRARQACKRTARIWLRLMAELESGITEKQLAARFTQEFINEGMTPERAYIMFGPCGAKLINGTPIPTDAPLKKGYFARCDVQGRYDGYMCNMSRVIGFGKVTPAMEKAQALVRGMVDRLAPELRPGVTAAAIRGMEMKLYEGTGYKPVVPYTGHGVGRVVHEPPYLYEKDRTVLEPGVIVTLEPTVTFTSSGDLNISIEDQYVITEDGNECLTRDAPLDLYL
ncbi:MAG: aminopeptidase P family protein [Chloroflexi bacterium]|nr:aminopeptidase P family protein [Chloroflexota bacterium]